MSHPKCGAKKRDGSGECCGLPAGWGTDHVGEGRCKLHGGNTPRGADSPHFRHGQRSAHVDPSDLVGFDEWEREVGPQLNLERRLLALLYMAEQMVLKREDILMKVGDRLVPVQPDADYIATVLNKLSRTHERMVKRREGETVHVKLSQPEVKQLITVMGEALADHVSDETEARAVIEAIKSAGVGLPEESADE